MRYAQPRLLIELKLWTDAAMTVDPRTGRSNASAMRRVRTLLRDHPGTLELVHFRHNLGVRRMAWLKEVHGQL